MQKHSASAQGGGRKGAPNALERLRELEAKASLKSRSQQRDAAKVTQQFIADFEFVAEYYNLRALGEYEQAKESARRDLKNAIECYAAIASSLRMEAMAAGINERIKARIELEREAV